GAEYDVYDLLKFQSRLQDSGYFSIAAVTAQPDPEDPAVAPVTVRVEENKLQTLGFGVGYSTNTGARAQANYEYNNVLGRGWRSVSSLKLETKAQSVQTDLYLPVNAQNHRWSYGGKAERSDLNGLLSRTGSAYMRRGEITGDIERQIG